MRTFRLATILALLGCGYASHSAQACQVLVTYFVFAVDDSTGAYIGGHWQQGWEDIPCDSGGGGSYGGGGGASGSGGGGVYGPTIPPALQALHDAYMNECGLDIPYGEFLSQQQYNLTSFSQNFPWDSYKNSQSDYVLLNADLISGTQAISNCMSRQGAWLPPIGQPWGGGTGYRLPDGGTQTGCKGHALGTAVDLSISNPPAGVSSCQFWNKLADCAHANNAFVEDYAQIIASGDPHFHYSYGKPPNTPAEYGDACNP